MMYIIRKAFSTILIISISLMLMAISIEQNSYNRSYYRESFKKYNVETISNKSMDDLLSIADNIIVYLKNTGGDELLTPYFNEREVLHMQDVQRLFKIVRYIKYIGGVLSICIGLYLFKINGGLFLSRVLYSGLYWNYIILIVLLFFVYYDFDRYFTYFHLLLFNNNLWILNPDTDLMIQMLPEGFFIGMAIKIMLSFSIYLAIIQVLAYIYKRRNYHGKDIR